MKVENEMVNGASRHCAAARLRVAGGRRISLRENLRETFADDVGHFSHEVADLLPFVREEIQLQLGMDGPLGIDLRAFPGNEDPEQFHLP